MNYRLARKPVLLLISALLIFETTLIAQVKFEKGYIIDKDNQRVECLIRNTDARKTPHSFSYRLTAESKTITVTPTDVKEVTISGYARYISAKVRMDRSSDNTRDIDQLSSSREPEWKEEALFLKVLVEGKAATLYAYNETDLVRFFYSKANGPVEQLVYKPFRINQTAYDFNKEYLDQLSENISCTSSNPSGRKPDYDEGDLEKYFIVFNGCNGSPVAAAPKPPKTKRFSIMLLAGAEHTSFGTEDPYGFVYKFNSQTKPLFGGELECALPFNRNKISLVLSINNSSYTSSGKDERSDSAHLSLSTLEAAIGPRYRFFLGDDFSLFLNAMLVVDIKSSGTYYASLNPPFVGTSAPVVAFGGGCSYKDFSVEFRYAGAKELFTQELSYESRLTRTSLTVKYRILNF